MIQYDFRNYLLTRCILLGMRILSECQSDRNGQNLHNRTRMIHSRTMYLKIIRYDVIK